MSFQQERSEHLNTITACSAHTLQINQQDYNQSVLLSPTLIEPLALRQLSELNDEIWNRVIACSPEVLLIGTGTTHKFVPPAQLARLYHANIGVECMNSHAASRTYNVLMNEGRKVVAIILISE